MVNTSDSCIQEMTIHSPRGRLLSRLSPREQQVLNLIVNGYLNKQIAAELGIALRTVETHRASIRQKLQVDSVAGLVRLVLITHDEDRRATDLVVNHDAVNRYSES